LRTFFKQASMWQGGGVKLRSGPNCGQSSNVTHLLAKD